MAVADITIDQAACVLAARQVSHRAYGLNKQAVGIADIMGNTNGTLGDSAKVTMRNALLGAGAGAVGSLPFTMMSQRRKKNYGLRALRGALLGGAIAGGGTAAYHGLSSMGQALQPPPDPKADANAQTVGRSLANPADAGIGNNLESLGRAGAHLVNKGELPTDMPVLDAQGKPQLGPDGAPLTRNMTVSDAGRMIAPGGADRAAWGGAGGFATGKGLQAFGRHWRAPNVIRDSSVAALEREGGRAAADYRAGRTNVPGGTAGQRASARLGLGMGNMSRADVARRGGGFFQHGTMNTGPRPGNRMPAIMGILGAIMNSQRAPETLPTGALAE